MRRSPWVCLAAVLGACASTLPQPAVAPARGSLPPLAEQAYRALDGRFDRAAAMDVVAFLQQYWRIAGNPGFDASIDHLRGRLERAGLPVVRVEEFPSASPGWDYERGSLWIAGESEPVLSKERDGVSLAINSFSTPERGLTARLVDAGRGEPANFGGRDVRGAVVMGDAGLGALWREAVQARGAAGVISTEIAAYVRPDDPRLMDEAHKDVLQWGSVPYDEARAGFGFKASWRAAGRLRAALARDSATRVRVDVASRFHRRPTRTLVAEIPGSSRAGERIVMVAHVQEPGANDNASGSATLYALARALQEAIAQGAIPRPARTLTFLWLDEMRGSREWLRAHPEEARRVHYMFSLDMTGEDTSRTGGTFLIEKQADPSAVWPRPSDPHSEWGAGGVTADGLKGSLLNDLHIAVAARRARDTGWVVKTNPYEGGSDHTIFASVGVPSLLNWHFTDRYYHTNQDTLDKVSAAEMEHVGVTIATSAYVLAAAGEPEALALVDLLEGAAAARLALERQQAPALVAAATDTAAARQTEALVLAAWIKWYEEAFESVASLPSGGVTPALRQRIDAAEASLRRE